MNVLKISKRAIFASLARVAKLVDALSSGGSIRKVVLVRIQSRAQKKPKFNSSVFLIYNITMCLFAIHYSPFTITHSH